MSNDEQDRKLQDLKHYFDILTTQRTPVTHLEATYPFLLYIGSTDLETWQATVQYAKERSQALDLEVEQLRDRKMDIVAYKGRMLIVARWDGEHEVRAGQSPRETDDEYLVRLLGSLILERRAKKDEIARLKKVILEEGGG